MQAASPSTSLHRFAANCRLALRFGTAFGGKGEGTMRRRILSAKEEKYRQLQSEYEMEWASLQANPPAPMSERYDPRTPLVNISMAHRRRLSDPLVHIADWVSTSSAKIRVFIGSHGERGPRIGSNLD